MSEKNNDIIIPSEMDNSINEPNTDNIFWELDFWEEYIEEVKVVEEKNLIKTLANIFTYFNFVLAFVLVLFWLYAYLNLQTSNTFSFLNPVCKYILWDVQPNWACSGITYYKDRYDNITSELSWKIFVKQLPLFITEYWNENIWNTKEVQFLLDKSQNKLNPIDILEDFDWIKNDFISKDRDDSTKYFKWDKRALVCDLVNITDDLSMKIKCTFFTYDLSSMKLASEFQRDVEADWTFKVTSKQENFTQEDISSWEQQYNYSTVLNLNLKYIWESYLK